MDEFVEVPPHLPQGLSVIDMWFQSRPWQQILFRINTKWQETTIGSAFLAKAWYIVIQ